MALGNLGKYSAMLQSQPNPNNGTLGGGLSHVLQQALMGYSMGQDQRAEEATQGRLTQMLKAMTGTPDTQGFAPDEAYNPPGAFGAGVGGPPPLSMDPDRAQITIPGQAPDLMGAINIGAEDPALQELAFGLLNQRNQGIAAAEADAALYERGRADDAADYDRNRADDIFDANAANDQAMALAQFRVDNRVPTAPAKPYTDAGKAKEDFDNGFITPEEYEQVRIDAEGLGLSEDAFANADKLRDELNALSKDYLSVRDAYSRIGAAAQDPSPAGDLALIFNYMKILDPGSVVRESEFAQAAATGSYGEQIQAAVQRIGTGERLTEVQRKDFVDRARRLFESQAGNYQANAAAYTSLAKSFGIDPSLVVVDYSPVDPARNAPIEDEQAALSVAPEGVDQETWDNMTDERKALWQ